METQEAEGGRRRRTKKKERGKRGEAEEVKVNERKRAVLQAQHPDLLNVLPLPQIRCQPGGLKVVQTTSAMPGG